jgi:hypothetical protein
MIGPSQLALGTALLPAPFLSTLRVDGGPQRLAFGSQYLFSFPSLDLDTLIAVLENSGESTLQIGLPSGNWSWPVPVQANLTYRAELDLTSNQVVGIVMPGLSLEPNQTIVYASDVLLQVTLLQDLFLLDEAVPTPYGL